MSGLRIAPGLELDPDYVAGGTFALLAKKGAGKTYTGRVMAEELWKAKVPFVVLDPMGAWWGLRSSADGAGDGLPVAIFGGDHGDAPLERGAGALMADLVVDEGLSMILDLKRLGTRAAERQFALDFLERLYRRNSELVHLFVDEADLFAPQKPQSGDQQLLGVTENIVRRGRNAGIGITLITQRPAVLNKDVLTQVDGLVAMRIVGLTDREAIDKWVEGHGDPAAAAQVKGTLAGLANGECWWWVPELDILQRVQVRRARTFDSSPTRKRGDQARAPKSFADVDMAAIEKRMADTIERAKAVDPKHLQRRVRELEAKIASHEPERVEVPVLTDEAREALGRAAKAIDDAQRAMIDAVADASQQLTGLLDRLGTQAASPPLAQRPVRAAAAPAPPRSAPRPARAAPVEPRDGDLTGPQQRVLDALAWLATVGFPRPTKIQVGFISGYRVGKKVGGTFGNVLGELRSTGLIDYPSPGSAALTDEGRALAQQPDIEPTTEGLQAAVYARLDGPERRVLEVLVHAYPDALPKQEVGELAGYTVGDKVGGTFGNILGRLRSLGLIDYPSPGFAAAEPVLFLEPAR